MVIRFYNSLDSLKITLNVLKIKKQGRKVAPKCTRARDERMKTLIHSSIKKLHSKRTCLSKSSCAHRTGGQRQAATKSLWSPATVYWSSELIIVTEDRKGSYTSKI